MNTYEGLFVVKPDLSEDNAKGAFKLIADSIAKNGGMVKKEELWGKKQIAYRIKKQRDGYYYKVNFEIEPNAMSKLEAAYKLNTDIIRTLITRK